MCICRFCVPHVYRSLKSHSLKSAKALFLFVVYQLSSIFVFHACHCFCAFPCMVSLERMPCTLAWNHALCSCMLQPTKGVYGSCDNIAHRNDVDYQTAVQRTPLDSLGRKIVFKRKNLTKSAKMTNPSKS